MTITLPGENEIPYAIKMESRLITRSTEVEKRSNLDFRSRSTILKKNNCP